MTNQEIFAVAIIVFLLGVIAIQLTELLAHSKGLKFVIEREAKRIINDSKKK